MTHKVLVKTIQSAYRNAGMAVKQKYGCTDLIDIVEKMEKEFNLKSFCVQNGWESDHYFEFSTEQDCLMFALKWS